MTDACLPVCGHWQGDVKTILKEMRTKEDGERRHHWPQGKHAFVQWPLMTGGRTTASDHLDSWSMLSQILILLLIFV
jgi:hypothetical protein